MARITICADGMKSASSSGFAARELAEESEAETYTGVQMELVNVMDATPGVIEIYKSSDSTLGGRSLWPHDAGITLARFLPSKLTITWHRAQRISCLLSSPAHILSTSAVFATEKGWLLLFTRGPARASLCRGGFRLFRHRS